MLLSLSLAAGAAGGLIAESNAIADEQRQLHLSGGDTVVVATAEGTGLDAHRCDELNRVEGVEAAGGISSTDSLSAVNSLGEQIRNMRATSGFVRVIHPTASGDGPIAGTQIAEELGLAQGAILTAAGNDQPIRITTVAGPSPRDSNFDSYVISPTAPTGEVRSCVVSADYGALEGVRALLNNWFDADQVSVSPFITRTTSDISPQDRFENRLMPMITVAAALLVVIGSGTYWTLMRREMALYRLMGLKNLELISMLSLQALVLVALPTWIGFGLVAGLSQARAEYVTHSVANNIAIYVLVIALTPLAGTVFLGRDPLMTLKDRE